MREIKFRAWDKEKKEMHIVSGISWINHKVYFEGTSEQHLEMVELMQYTYYKDCNNKDIYEGDIVGVIIDEDNVDYDEKPTNWLQIVKWDDDYHQFRIWEQNIPNKGTLGEEMYEADFDGNIMDLDDAEELEVIGNIYQSTDLIKGYGKKTSHSQL